jgi:hypothetical protein
MMRRFPMFLIALLVFGMSNPIASELRDVSMQCRAEVCRIAFQFDPSGALPSYFQKYDASTQSLRVAFSQTKIALPHGQWILDSTGQGLRRLNLRSESTSKGVPLLVFDFSVGPMIHSDQNPVALEAKGRFTLEFPKLKQAKPWNLRKLVQSSPKNPPAQPSLPPVAEVPQKSRAAGVPNGIEEIAWVRHGSWEQFTVLAQHPLSIRRVGQEIHIPLLQAQVNLAVQALAGSQLVRDYGVVRVDSSWVLRIRLRPAVLPLVLGKGARLLVQGTVSADDKQFFATARHQHKQGAYSRSFARPERTEELEDLEQFAKKFVGVDPGTQTFALRKGVRDLIVVVDQLSLLEKAESAGREMLVLRFGDRLEHLQQEKLYYKVRFQGVSGFVDRRSVAYPDELSHAQAERLASLDATNVPEDTDSLAMDAEDGSDDRITYSSFGRRDPFIELKGVVSDGVNIDGVELVGILWESEHPMVLLSDTRNPGVSYTLKEGDPILNGKVLKITQDEVLFLINEFGVSRRYTMTLPDKYGGKK